jgi:DNA-binding NarL/FixJ family response regulator
MADIELTPPARPRVLLADDHIALLDSVSHFLAADFDIVALARDGRQALDLIARLRPDVVVLDVTMPVLDGFRTLEHMRRDGPHTRVVFLTNHRDDDLVSAAINGGAHGYVLKSRLHVDLISAINHALAGRLFVPSLTSLSGVAGSPHTVQFHASDRQFLDEVSQLVRGILVSGEQVLIVSSEAIRIGVAQRLQARQMNLAMLGERGQYVEQDSAPVLAHMMQDGRPDEKRLGEVIRSLDGLRLAGPNGPRSRLTIIGDMTVSLCRNGNFETALEIERIWNELTRPLPFFTVCSYPIECFENSAARNQISRVCAEHRAVIS